MGLRWQLPAAFRTMVGMLAAMFAPPPAAAQAVQPGAWNVTSKIVELSVPGVPGFVQRMMKGKSKVEHKRLSAAQGMEALLAPDPKARCRVDDQRIVDGRYVQALTCPQKEGEPMRIVRAGTYDAAGFAGRATVSGTTPKGQIRIVLDQRGSRTGG